MNDSNWFSYWECEVKYEYTPHKASKLTKEFVDVLEKSYVSVGLGRWVLDPIYQKESQAYDSIESFIWLVSQLEDAALLILPQAYCILAGCCGLFNDGPMDCLKTRGREGTLSIQYETFLRYICDFERTKLVAAKMSPESLLLMVEWFTFVKLRAGYLFRKSYSRILTKSCNIFELEFNHRLFALWNT